MLNSVIIRHGPQALLWDCDGVLCDTERDGHRIAFNEAFKQKGLRNSIETAPTLSPLCVSGTASWRTLPRF